MNRQPTISVSTVELGILIGFEMDDLIVKTDIRHFLDNMSHAFVYKKKLSYFQNLVVKILIGVFQKKKIF